MRPKTGAGDLSEVWHFSGYYGTSKNKSAIKIFQIYKMLFILTTKNLTKNRVLAKEGFELSKIESTLITEVPLGKVVPQCDEAQLGFAHGQYQN